MDSLSKSTYWGKGERVNLMGIYIYGIIDSNDRIDESIRGLNGILVSNIPFKDISIVVSNFNDDIKNITKTQVLEHEDVLEGLMTKFTVLPVRFRTLYNKEKDALGMLEHFYADFKENLDKLRNKAEFGIKVIWPGDKIREEIVRDHDRDYEISAGSDSQGKLFIGQAYKKYKIDKEIDLKADISIANLDHFFSRFASEKRLEKLKSKNLLLNAFYLVERGKQRNFKEAFDTLRKAPGDLQYLFSGPWPPYNFVRIEYGKD